jgi:hypothetical protein
MLARQAWMSSRPEYGQLELAAFVRVFCCEIDRGDPAAMPAP